jgi:hypothetical protein
VDSRCCCDNALLVMFICRLPPPWTRDKLFTLLALTIGPCVDSVQQNEVLQALRDQAPRNMCGDMC